MILYGIDYGDAVSTTGFPACVVVVGFSRCVLKIKNNF